MWGNYAIIVGISGAWTVQLCWCEHPAKTMKSVIKFNGVRFQWFEEPVDQHLLRIN